MEQVVSNVYMIVLDQKDLKEAVVFYENLGLELIFNLEGKWAEFDLNGVRIGLRPTQIENIVKPTGIVLKTDDVQKMYDTLVNDGVEFTVKPTVATHGVMASFLDPSGNRLDLYQPTHEKVREVLEKAGKQCATAEKCCKKTEDKSCGIS